MESNKDLFEKHLGIPRGQLSKLFGKLLTAIVVSFLVWAFLVKPVIVRFWGVPEIGHLFEKRKPYDTDYYVNLFPRNAEAKNYRLKARITVSEDNCYGSDNGSEDDFDCYPGPIYLNRVTWPNGGASYFEECDIEINQKKLCWDNEKREWLVELTDQRVK